MLKKSLCSQTLVLSLFLLPGCEFTQTAQRDFNRLIHGDPFSTSRPTAQAYASAPRTTTTARPDSAKPADPAKPDDPKSGAQQSTATPAPAVNLVGNSE